MTMKIRWARVPLLFVLGAAFCNAAVAGDKITCSSLTSTGAVVETEDGHKVVLTVSNPTDSTVDLMAFYFESNTLRLQAVEQESKHPLSTLVPLVSPGVAPVRIHAKETFVREHDLRYIFPDLESTLTRSAVDVSWRLKLDPGPGCFSEEIKTTVTIPKKRAAR
jgi:hypothetical protein